jgi:hypothetical protein
MREYLASGTALRTVENPIEGCGPKQFARAACLSILIPGDQPL